MVRAVGDEWANSTQTLDGFTVVRNDTGVWTYGIKATDGRVQPTTAVAGRDQPPAASRGALPERAFGAPAHGGAAPHPAPHLGSRKMLVLLVQFADRAAVTTPADWNNRFFASEQGSVRDHYVASSYNQMAINPATETHGTANDGIVGWLSLPGNHPNIGYNTGPTNQQLTKDAIVAADPFVDFAAFDTDGNGTLSTSELLLVVVAAGNEAAFGGQSGSCSPSLWGHKWQVDAPPTVDGKTVGNAAYAQVGEMHCRTTGPPGQMATIGILAHELGHVLGLPDLYDNDGSSAGVGDWSLMSGGTWGTVNRQGDSPSLLDPWSKYFLGWVTPTPVVGPMPSQNIPASIASPTVFQFLSGSALSGTGEYFLIENRQQSGFDVQLDGSGLLVWHIDEAQHTNSAECVPGGSPTCSATVHYKVALIQADNAFHLELGSSNQGDAGDPFPGTSNRTLLTGATTPNANLWDGSASGVSITSISEPGEVMTATLTLGFGTLPGAFNKSTPASGAAGFPTNVMLTWAASSDATAYEYCVDTSNDDSCDGLWTSAGGALSVTPPGLGAASLYFWQVRAINAHGSTEANSDTWWSFATAGFLGATFDATLQVPRCRFVGNACDTGPELIRGNGSMSGGAEPNQPNTVNDSCNDGSLGVFHVNESIDRMRVFTVDGQPFAPGKLVTIEVTGFIFASGADRLDLYFAANANSPTWLFITTLTPAGNGVQVMSTNLILPHGSLQAVRARLRYQGSGGFCTGAGNQYDDHDDLAFAVNPPAFAGLVENGAFESGTAGWSTFGTPDSSYMVSNTAGGVFQFYRAAPPAGTPNQAVVFQNTGEPLSSGSAIEAIFDLGNSDTVRKRVSVLLHDSDFSDLFVCTFWLPANLAMTEYRIRTHTSKPWANATISFYAASANAAGNTTAFYRLDNVSIQLVPGLPTNQTTCHDPTTPTPPGGAGGPELIANGSFSSGLSSWTLYGQINGSVNAGVFEFIRLPGNPAGVILQSIGQTMTANQRLTATFQLGNSSGVRKRVTVILHDSNFNDLSACTFWLAPDQALSTYTYRAFATQAWANGTFSVYGATVGGEQYMRLDNVSMARTPAAAMVGTECVEP